MNNCKKLAQDVVLRPCKSGRMLAEFPDGGAGLPDKDEEEEESVKGSFDVTDLPPDRPNDPWEFYPETIPAHMSF